MKIHINGIKNANIDPNNGMFLKRILTEGKMRNRVGLRDFLMCVFSFSLFPPKSMVALAQQHKGNSQNPSLASQRCSPSR
jgi:hypothetical protein